MGIFRFDDRGQIVGFEEKPDQQRLASIGSSIPRGSTAGGVTAEKPFVASMGIYVFSREVLLEILEQPGVDFGREIIPDALGNHHVNPYIFRGYWADVGTIEAFYEANIQLTRRGAPFNFFHPRWPIYTHPRFLPGTRAYSCQIDASIVAEGSYLDHCQISESVVGIRTHVNVGARITRSVLLGADSYEEEVDNTRPARHRPRRRARPGDRRQERAHRGRRAAVNEARSRRRRRRRLLHPERHHHRSEGRGGEVRRLGLERAATRSIVPPLITRPATRPCDHHAFHHQSRRWSTSWSPGSSLNCRRRSISAQL